MPCGQFYASQCAFDSDTLTALVDLPPSAPPPPMAPDADLAQLTTTRVMAKGGLVDLDITQALTACADNAQTECVATSMEQPWLLFDLGAQHERLYSARLFLMPPSPPPSPALLSPVTAKFRFEDEPGTTGISPSANCINGDLTLTEANYCHSAYSTSFDYQKHETWLYVDLGVAFHVTSVRIYNGVLFNPNPDTGVRWDSRIRLGNHDIVISNVVDDPNTNPVKVCSFVLDTTANNGPFSEVCDGIGRYVYIRLPARAINFINLHEFQVFGIPMEGIDGSGRRLQSLTPNTGRRLEIEQRWADVDNITIHRRLQGVVVEPTGAIGGGVNVVCDLNVESDRVYTSTVSSTLSARQAYPATDALACEHDCVRNPLCNYWSWQQQTDTTGQCLLFNQVTAYLPADDASLTGYTVAGWVSGSCSPERNPTAYHMPGSLEIWVSRSLALFGTRAAVIDTTRLVDGETTVYLTEGADMAEGRYVYLRSFDSNRQLRIDGMHIFAMPDPGRRLEEDLGEKHAKHGKGEKGEKLKGHGDTNADRYADKKHIPNVPAFSWTRIWTMRNLTKITCMNETNAPLLSKESRQHAAMLWADLTEEESAIGCVSCVTKAPGNCTQWFKNLHGVRRGHTDELEKKRRRMREQLDRDEPERIRRLQEAVGDSCCRINKRTKEKKCGRQYCAKAIKKKAEQRMAHTLRNLHEMPAAKHVNLGVAQLVATDMVAPALHHNKNCQTEEGRDVHGHAECIASSVIRHLAKKHGFSEDDLNKKMERFGITLSDIVTSQLKHGDGKGQGKKKEFKSDVKAAEKAAALRRAEKAEKLRRKLGVEGAVDRAPQRKAPRASWLKKSTKAGRRLLEASEEDSSEREIGVEGLTTSGKELRLRKKLHDGFVRNQSYAAKDIMKAANLATASHGGTPISMSNLMGAAWEASLASDGSLIGRMRSVATGVGKMGEAISNIHKVVKTAAVEAPPPPPPRKRRKLSPREEAYFDRVDNLTKGKSRGWQVPDHIDEKWGWVVDAIDWSYWWGETHRVGRILYSRHEWVHQHAEDTGTLPVGELPEHHKTGYSLLDINAPPSTLGTWIRSKFDGGDRHAPHRRLKEKQTLTGLPRAPPPEGYQARSVIGSFFDAAVNNADPINAVWEALHYNDHSTQPVRRLAELSNWVTQNVIDTSTEYAGQFADTVFGPSTGLVPGDATTDSGLDFPRQIARYAAYDTILCYMYPPPHMEGSPMGDGSPIELH